MLRRNLKRGVFGSQLAARLVLLFALVAVLPGALVYAVSVQFLGRSIESWFDVRVDRALEGGLALGRNALDYLGRETTNKATQIAAHVGDAAGGYPIVLVARGRAGRRRRGRAVLGAGRRPRGRGHRDAPGLARAATRAGVAPRAAPAGVHGGRHARPATLRCASSCRSTAPTATNR